MENTKCDKVHVVQANGRELKAVTSAAQFPAACLFWQKRVARKYVQEKAIIAYFPQRLTRKLNALGASDASKPSIIAYSGSAAHFKGQIHKPSRFSLLPAEKLEKLTRRSGKFESSKVRKFFEKTASEHSDHTVSGTNSVGDRGCWGLCKFKTVRLV